MPEQIIREISRIKRYARHNEAEDYAFRDYLKFHLPLSNNALDTLVLETTDTIWRQIDCTTCANCCRTLQIVVDEKDIRRLARRFAMTPRDFTAQYVQTDADKTRFFAVSPCPFLGADNRCTVYEDRPQACRDFPYLHEKNVRSRSLTMVENTAVCPIVFNVWESLKRQLGTRQRGKR
jgi:Fe-S-cluster containining protein